MKNNGEVQQSDIADHPKADRAPDQSSANSAQASFKSASPPPKSIQFGVGGLLIFTTGFCVLLAILKALGVSYANLLFGFAATSGISLLVILLLEVHKHFATRQLAQQQFSETRRNPYAAPDAPPLPSRRQSLLDAPVDPRGIDFIDPEGIEFVSESPAPDESDTPDNNTEVYQADLAEEAATDAENSRND
jgi:hypothetical protein